MSTPDFTFSSLFADGMVLQRGRARLWGWGRAGARVTLGLAGQRLEVTVDPQGLWKAEWDELPVGGPYELTVDGEVRFANVWVGDVWLCSGQSNMERTLVSCAPWPDDAQAWRGDPGIRQMLVPLAWDFQGPRDEASGVRWMGAETEEVRLFSAVGFHFARDLRQRTGVPQGLVLNAVGGAPLAAWLSARALEDHPLGRDEARRCADTPWVESVQAADQAREAAWYADVDARDPCSPPVADDWQPIDFADLEAGRFRGECGSFWLRRRFVLGPEWAGRGARLRLGNLVNGDTTFLNGTVVGTTGYQYPTRRYEVPAGVLVEGENTLLVRLLVPEGRAGVVPEKGYFLEGPSRLDLEGAWEWRTGARAPFLPPRTFFQYKAGGLYNAVLFPLKNLALSGVLWYQGESNAEAPGDYAALLHSLVADWRRTFERPDLAFLVVQLPLWGRPFDGVEDDGWPLVRDAQTRVLELPNTALVSALDLGEWNELHPANKAPLGPRLARAARRLVWGESLDPWMGPLATEARLEDRRVVIAFDQVGAALAWDGEPGAFFVGSNGEFHRAPARIEGATVVLESPVSAPQEVRYAWARNPVGATLVNAVGLRASPFRLPVASTIGVFP